MRSLLVVISGVLLLAQALRAQNLLVNGSFESPDVEAGTALVYPDGDVPGWSDSSGGLMCGIEIQDHCCGSPSDGEQHAELDTQNCSGAISQSVATQAGASYVLTFDFAARPGGFMTFYNLLVRWNGSEIFNEIEQPLGEDTNWVHHSIAVTATGPTSTVEFSDGSSDNNGMGPYVDNVPEPGRTAQLLAGALLLAALARKSRTGVGPR
jgi:hypothetical protein